MSAEGVHLFILDDDGILFSQRAQKVFALNTSATLIWCWLDQGVTEPEIARRLAEGSGLPLSDSTGHLEQLLDQWRAQGLIEGGEDVAQANGRLLPDEPEAELPDTSGRVPEFSCEQRYRLLDTTFVIRFTCPTVAGLVESCFRHLTDDGATPPDADFGVAETNPGYLVLQNGEAKRWCEDIHLVVPVVKHLIAAFVMNRTRYLLNVHAGVVATRRGCLLLPGVAGSGKSTLTAALAKKGYTYFSDEYGLLEHDSLAVRAVPLPLCVKSSGSEVIAELYPGLMALPAHTRFDNKVVRYMPPPGPQDGVLDLRRPVEAIIFPRYDPLAETCLTPLRKVEALHRLMEHCLVVPEWFDHHKVARLVEWVSGLDCHALTFSSLKVAVELIARRWR